MLENRRKLKNSPNLLLLFVNFLKNNYKYYSFFELWIEEYTCNDQLQMFVEMFALNQAGCNIIHFFTFWFFVDFFVDIFLWNFFKRFTYFL